MYCNKASARLLHPSLQTRPLKNVSIWESVLCAFLVLLFPALKKSSSMRPLGAEMGHSAAEEEVKEWPGGPLTPQADGKMARVPSTVALAVRRNTYK